MLIGEGGALLHNVSFFTGSHVSRTGNFWLFFKLSDFVNMHSIRQDNGGGGGGGSAFLL